MYATHDSHDESKIVLRNAEQTDAAVIRDIASTCGIDAWSVDQYREEAGRSDAAFFIAVEGLNPVGFISGRIVPSASDGLDGEIYNIAVSPDSRRNGIGREMLKNAINRFALSNCNAVWLEVRESNHRAIQFYENNGFTRVTTRRNFYSAPVEDAIVMRLTLIDRPSPNRSPNA